MGGISKMISYMVVFEEFLNNGQKKDRKLLLELEKDIPSSELNQYIKLIIFSKYIYGDYDSFKINEIIKL